MKVNEEIWLDVCWHCG